jgi:hypothetical protein
MEPIYSVEAPVYNKRINHYANCEQRDEAWKVFLDSCYAVSPGKILSFRRSAQTVTIRMQSQDCNSACGSVWVWNLVSHIKGGTQTERVEEQELTP